MLVNPISRQAVPLLPIDSMSDDTDAASDSFVTPLSEYPHDPTREHEKRDNGAFINNEGGDPPRRKLVYQVSRHSEPTPTELSTKMALGSGIRRPKLGYRSASADSVQVEEDDIYSGTRPTAYQNVRNLQVPGSHQLRRSSSSSGLEIRSTRHISTLLAASSKTSQNRPTQHVPNPPFSQWRVRRLGSSGDSGYSQRTRAGRSGSPIFRWFSIRANSYPSTPTVVNVTKRGQNIPLKPCMKQKSRSAATTPPDRRARIVDEEGVGQPLRRTKTVEFEDAIPTDPLLSPLEVDVLNLQSPKLQKPGKLSAPRRENHIIHTPPSKLPPELTRPHGQRHKSKPADTAITRTDVHVVAIAPLRINEGSTHDDTIDSATPTMQIVESENGYYEIIWNEIPVIDEMRHRQLETVTLSRLSQKCTGPAGGKGLESVNNKLTQWWWSNGETQTPSRPRIVVFPDEDEGYFADLDHQLEDDKSTPIAPPNSESTSAAPSRQVSHPPSSRPSRNASIAGTDSNSELEDSTNHEQKDSQPTPVINPPVVGKFVRGKFFIKGKQDLNPMAAERRFSNIDDDEMKFRGHRDSLTLARLRILNAGGVSPELFMHRDSVAIAKKRMHSRNHAAYTPRSNPHSRIAFSEPLPSADHSTSITLTSSKI